MKLLPICLIGLTVFLSGCGQQGGQAPAAESVKADAPTLYKNYCMSCHGSNLQGAKGPSLQKIGDRLDEEDLILRIQKGGGGMPPFQVSMTDEDVKALAAWLAAMK